MSFVTMLYVMIGGALGSLARYLLSLVMLPVSRDLPWGTITINILGSFVIGFFGTLTLAQGRFPVSENWRLFVMVGICGGFTTFSSFSLQTLDLMRSGAMVRAGLNIVLSVALCVAAVALGHFVAAQLNQHAPQVAQIPIEEEADVVDG
ncbi:MAG: fluoride efflux transporter CrcB [Alphaproteobacteria bacterium]|nr:fluoride efflux transporter CrcB [Alphaproteobacteria bacterium]MBL6939521.1 fluoride efflux transporter CrcB [Alphaproteobacteria bacterium]MBL7100105.1 fluoride efflux transporter CrcB [Alphaproteobacteria bacterium]